MIMETERPHDLLSASCTPEEVRGVIAVPVRGPENEGSTWYKPQTKGRRRRIWSENEFAQRETQQEIGGQNCAFTQFWLQLCPFST